MKLGRIVVVLYSSLLIAIGLYFAVQGLFYRDSLMIPFSENPWLMLILGLIFVAGGIVNMTRSFRSVFWGCTFLGRQGSCKEPT